MKKLHILIPSLVATVGMPLVSMVGCGGEREPEVTPTNITISQTEATIIVLESIQLTAQVEPQGASDKVTWTSSDDSVAIVSSSGKVTGMKKGTATITVKPDGYDLQATCTITVINPDPIVGEVVVEDLEEEYTGEFNVDGQTNKLTTYYVKGEDKTDISDSVSFVIDNKNFSYDEKNKCICWTKATPPKMYNINIVVIFGTTILAQLSTTIEIEASGVFHEPEIPEINVTRTTGSCPITFWYTMPDGVTEVNVTPYCDLIFSAIPGVEWDNVNKSILWDGNVIDFGAGETIFINANVQFGIKTIMTGFTLHKNYEFNPLELIWFNCF